MHISEPDYLHVSPVEFYCQIVRNSAFSNCLDDVLSVLKSSEQFVSECLRNYQGKHLDSFIHVLNVTLFIQSIHQEKTVNSQIDAQLLPLTSALNNLFNALPLETVISLLPVSLIDVLTAHPVDMDRGLVVSIKNDYEKLCRLWQQKKQVYFLIEPSAYKLALRDELNDIRDSIKNTILKLLYTPNYRQIKIRPESEQRHISRAIKDYENSILSHWNKLLVIVQVMALKRLLRCLIDCKHISAEQYEWCLDLPNTTVSLEKLKAIETLQLNSLFEPILSLPKQINYQLHTWRGDMDGNPFVNYKTFQLSIAYGRKRCFERISADEALIRYKDSSNSFVKLEEQMTKHLEALLANGTLEWKTYIKSRLDEQWNAAQIYSGLAYFRMVELTDSAEAFLRNPNNIQLLKQGYRTADEFLEFTEVLEKIELSVGIQNGIWLYLRQLVQLRQLSLGKPHIRNGESYHVSLLESFCQSRQILLPKPIATLSTAEQEQFLRQLLNQNIESITQNDSAFIDYYFMMQTDAKSALIQSDSATVMKSVKAAILLLKVISKLINHQGDVIVLCENEDSMKSAITLMNESIEKSFFDGVVMMCAGSDNQKKLGPFYSTYLNHLFLQTAYQKGIRAFFGVGDSPLRSALYQPITAMKTFQPGSRKHHFFGDRVQLYLSNRLANYYQQVLQLMNNDKACEQNMFILNCLGESMLSSYQSELQCLPELSKQVKAISEIVTTYFSRPSKKATTSKAELIQIRAIDLARAQLILNTFDPQLAGLKQGMNLFYEGLQKANITDKTCHTFFNETAVGQAILGNLIYYATLLDDTIQTSEKIKTVSVADIHWVYQQLSGKALSVKPDRYLQSVRQVWQYVNSSSELHNHKAQALMLFGSNWMV